jgi:quercetin dioxygenase-like cupin family protein
MSRMLNEPIVEGYQLTEIVAGLTDMDFRQLASFNGGSVGIFKSSAGVSPWERHPNHEELLHVLDGEVDIVVLKDQSPTVVKLKTGSIFVVPRGLWHRHKVKNRLVELYVSPSETEHSSEDDPRVGTEP